MTYTRPPAPAPAPPLPGSNEAADLNTYLLQGEVPWPFPGSPSKATLEQRKAEAQGTGQ
jgi:hypothetical protein